MTSFFQTPRPQAAAGDRVLGLSEILPRISLIEEAVEGLRILEFGVIDVRSLIHLEEAGAERVAGTTATIEQLDRVSLAGHRIELISMDEGRLDFPSAAFDVVLVNNLSANVQSNPRFFFELKRVLAPDGFCVLAFDASGHSVAELVNPQDQRVQLARPRQMVQLVREQFEPVQFLEQTPFVGVALLSENADPLQVPVSLDASLAGLGAQASHIVALCGHVAPVGEQRTLVELPFTAMEEAASQQHAHAQNTVQSLEKALQETRIDLQAREDSLKSISARLKPLREAVIERLGAPNSVSDNSIVAVETQAMVEELQFEIEAERARRHALEAQLNSNLNAPEVDDNQRAKEALESKLETSRLDKELLQHRILELQRQLESRSLRPALISEDFLQLEITLASSQKECDELKDRLESAERQLRARMGSSVAPPMILVEDEDDELDPEEVSLWHRLAELEQENELQRRRIQDLESSTRQAQSSLRDLKQQSEISTLEKSRADAGLKAKIAALAGALQVSDAEVQELRSLLDSAYDRQSTLTSNSERALDEAQNRFGLEREIAGQMQAELDAVRQEAYEARISLEQVQRTLLARNSEFEELRTRYTGAQADKSALEMVTAQLTQESDSLRSKFYNLKAERDTLMETSRSLIDERDVAVQFVDGVGESERRVRELTDSVEGGQAAIRRLEWELDASQDKIRTLEDAVQQHAHIVHQNEIDQDDSRERAVHFQTQAEQAQSYVLELEQRIAQMQQNLLGLEQLESQSKDDVVDLERLLQEVSREAMEYKRELASWKDRTHQLQADEFDAQEAINDLIAEQLRLEAALVESESERLTAESRVSLERASSALLQAENQGLLNAAQSSQEQGQANIALQAEVEQLEIQMAGLLGAKEEAELGLGRTLEEAAGLVGQIQELEEANRALVIQVNRLADSELFLEQAEAALLVLSSENQDLQVQLQAQSIGLSSESMLKSEMAVLRDECEDLRGRNQILTTDRDALRTELESPIPQPSEIDIVEDIEPLHDEIARLTQILVKEQTAHQSTQEKCGKLESLTARYETETEGLVQQMMEFDARSKEYDAQFREAQSVAMDALDQLQAHELATLEREQRDEHYQNEKTAMILRIKSLEDTVREAEARTPDIESLHATQTELHATKEELAALTELNSSLREAWETVSSELSDQTMSYEQASLDARDREYELEQKLREYGEVSSIQESELKSQIEDATTSERNARELAREAKRQNEAGFRRIAELESEIIQLKNSLVATPASPQADLQVKFETAQQELEQLQMQKNQIYNQMDAVRVDLGHKLQDIRQLKEALNSTRDELGEQMQSNKKLAAALKQAREASGSAEKARERAQLIERLEAQTNTLASENQRLRQLAHREEDDRVEVEMKLSTLENAVLERNRRIELLQREVADKAERLRRFAERIDKI